VAQVLKGRGFQARRSVPQNQHWLSPKQLAAIAGVAKNLLSFGLTISQLPSFP